MSSEHLSAERQEREPGRNDPRIYAASLTDYNHGILHGEWIGAAVAPADLLADIGDMLERSPTAEQSGEKAEEWAIHDYEGFGSLHLSEHESLENVTRLARGIAEHGPAFTAWANLVGIDEDLDAFEEAYQGHYGSREEYGEQMAEDYGVYQAIDDLPEIVRDFITVDPDRVVRDMELEGDIHLAEAEDGGVYVFDAHA